MRITARDLEILTLINECRWLSTGQIQRTFFQGVSVNAVNKRLRKFVEAGYLYAARRSRFDEYYYRLMPRARILLEAECGIPQTGPRLGRSLPGDLAHYSMINDIWLAFKKAVYQRGGRIELFLSDRDIKREFPELQVIPDDLVIFRASVNGEERFFLIEVDMGTENPLTFAKKISIYQSSNGLVEWIGPAEKIIIFLKTRQHVVRFAEKILVNITRPELFYLTSLEDFKGQNIGGEIFLSLKSLLQGDTDLVSVF